MKKMNEAICCDDCFHEIAKQNTNAARLWVELCSMGFCYSIFDLDFPELTLLESMGFITSIEDPHYEEGILVRVNGKKSGYFCRGTCA